MYECQRIGQMVLAQCKQSLWGDNVLDCLVSLEIQVCFIIISLFLVLFLLFFQLVFGLKY